MKKRAGLCSLFIYSIFAFAQANEVSQHRSAPVAIFNICAYIEKSFGFKNNTAIQLGDVKKFLNFSSKFCALEPRATAESIMHLSGAEDIYFFCKNISQQQDFTAAVSFSYTVQGASNQQTIMLRLLPPDEKRKNPPPVLEIPTTPQPAIEATPDNQPANPVTPQTQ